MSKVCDIILSKIISKRKTVVVFIIGYFDVIFNIRNILATSCPAVAITLAAYRNFHSILKRGVIF